MRPALIGLVTCCFWGCAGILGDPEMNTQTKDVGGVVVRIAIKPGKEDEFVALIQRTMIEPTQEAPGCLRYEMWQDREEPWRFAIIEEWESEEAHTTHLAQEWLHQAAAAFEGFTATPFEMQRLRKARSTR